MPESGDGWDGVGAGAALSPSFPPPAPDVPADPAATQQFLARIAAARPGDPGLGFAVVAAHDSPPPHPAEVDLAVAEGFAPSRRAEFLLGRGAARAALADADLDDGPVRRSGRRPLFPPGSTGSISHCGGVAVALAGASSRYRSLGIDLEVTPPPLSAAHLILGDDERAWMSSGATAAEYERRLLRAFCAKEAAFKALHPLLADNGLPQLRRIVLRPLTAGFAAWVPGRPEPVVTVTVTDLEPGVLAWTSVPSAPDH